MPYASRQKQLDYNRRYNQETTERRIKLLAQFPCLCCGDPDDTVIQWHHVKPDDKSIGIWERCSENDWWLEVLKCIPVCANCHVKIHKNKLCLLPPKLR